MVSSQIIQDCIKQKSIAHKELYETCAPYVFSIVKTYIFDEHFRRDAMQEIFSQIFCSLERFDDSKGAFKSWIAQIAVNRSVSLLKKTKTIDYVFEMESLKEIPENQFAFLDQLTRTEIDVMLSNMPTGYRTVFLLNKIDGYKHAEISEMLEIKVETSRSQLLRAVKWIQKNKTNFSELKFKGYETLR